MTRRVHIEELASGSFSARVSHPEKPGVRVRITAESRAEVERKVEKAVMLSKEIRAGEVDPKEFRRRWMAIVAGAPTVKEIWDAYAFTLRGQWRAKVESIWRSHFADFGGFRAWELSRERMAKWERRERERVSAKTVENAWHALRAAYRAAIGEKVDAIPWGQWRPQGPPVGAETRESCRNIGELEALIAACAAYDQRLRELGAPNGKIGDLAVRVLVSALTGLRQGEMVALRWSDLALDGEGDELHMVVQHSAHYGWSKRSPEPLDPPKGNKIRTQTLHRDAAMALRHQRDKLRALGLYRPDGPVFPTPEGGFRKTVRCIEPDVFRRCVAAAGIPTEAGRKWVPHSTRHTFSTLEVFAAFMNTGDVQTARKRTGHSRVETLVGYLGRANRGRPQPQIGGLAPLALAAATGIDLATLAPPRTVRALPASVTERATAYAMDRVVHPKASRSLVELAEAHHGGEIPHEVEREAEKHYRAAYARAQRKGLDPERCVAAGNRAKRGYFGAWAKVVSTREKAAAAAGKEG